MSKKGDCGLVIGDIIAGVIRYTIGTAIGIDNPFVFFPDLWSLMINIVAKDRK